MNVRCGKCGTINAVPDDGTTDKVYHCHNCGAFLPKNQPTPGDTSAVVGMIGGAAFGAAVGGPLGAIIGAVIGAAFGREAKGVG